MHTQINPELNLPWFHLGISSVHDAQQTRNAIQNWRGECLRIGCLLDGASFDSFYRKVSADGDKRPEASEFCCVKEALIDQFGDGEDAQDLIKNSMA